MPVEIIHILTLTHMRLVLDDIRADGAIPVEQRLIPAKRGVSTEHFVYSQLARAFGRLCNFDIVTMCILVW